MLVGIKIEENQLSTLDSGQQKKKKEEEEEKDSLFMQKFICLFNQFDSIQVESGWESLFVGWLVCLCVR